MLKFKLMQDAVKARIFFFLAGLIVVPVATVLVVMFARGYRPDFEKKEILATGLLVAHSYPESAQIFIDDRLRTATNATINLAPGQYEVEIKKDGFHPWKKYLAVETEVVTRATATLFPSVPGLKQITTDGAVLPVLSPDGSKVVYTSPNYKNLYILDLNESPLGLINRDPRLLSTFPGQIIRLQWSPDSRQILAGFSSASPSGYLIDASGQQSRNVSANLSALLASWQTSLQARNEQKFSTLPQILQDFMASSSANLNWSPRENKILYTATASAQMPDRLIKPLPGSSTQPQERLLTPDTVYVYDLEEDRNFKVGEQTGSGPDLPPNAGFRWFTTSSHLFRIESDTITIIEYDSQNPTVVYTGPLESQIALPYPSAKQMLILTNLDPTRPPAKTDQIPGILNLYALILR